MKNVIIAQLCLALILLFGCADSNAQQKTMTEKGATVKSSAMKVSNQPAELDPGNPEHMADPAKFEASEKAGLAKEASENITAIGMKLSKDLHDFGTVPQGKPVSHIFEFVNSSDAPIKLDRVKPACGCTAVDYTKDEVAPGATGYVKAQYNAAKKGAFNKSVSVFANGSKKPVILRFRGVVEAKNAPAEGAPAQN